MNELICFSCGEKITTGSMKHNIVDNYKLFFCEKKFCQNEGENVSQKHFQQYLDTLPHQVVLWLSRHSPIPLQLDTLEKKLGQYKFIRVAGRVVNAEHALQLAKQHKATYILPILPMSFIMHLVQASKHTDFKILYAEMELLHDDPIDTSCPDFDSYRDNYADGSDIQTGLRIKRHYRFKSFSVLKDIVFDKEKL